MIETAADLVLSFLPELESIQSRRRRLRGLNSLTRLELQRGLGSLLGSLMAPLTGERAGYERAAGVAVFACRAWRSAGRAFLGQLF